MATTDTTGTRALRRRPGYLLLTAALAALGLPALAPAAAGAAAGDTAGGTATASARPLPSPEDRAPGFAVPVRATTTDTPPEPVRHTPDPSLRFDTTTVTNPDGSVTATTTATRITAPGSPASGPQSTISVIYHGFTPQAQNAFQAAVNIWAGTLSSSVPIVVDATFEDLGVGVLGMAGADVFLKNQAGMPKAQTWYPIALANALAGTDLDPGFPDIDALFSSTFNFYFGTDGNPAPGQYDFETVVLHELGHGLGFVGSADKSGSTYTLGAQSNVGGAFYPMVYDTFVEVGAQPGTPVTNHIGNSAQLGLDFTGDDLFFDGPKTSIATGGGRAPLYAPALWNPGSSYAHLRDASFPAGSANALMTPFVASQEVLHSPGPIVLGMFQDMGWQLASTVPAAPTNVVAVAGQESAGLTWTAPPSDSWAPTTGFVITANPSGAVLKVGNVTNATFNGLAGNVATTFSVSAVNSLGAGPAGLSNSVIPTAAPNPALRFKPVVPFRILDSRNGTGFSGAVGQDAFKDLPVANVGAVPSTATAVVMNVTVTGGTSGSFLSVFPSGNARPLAANLNFAAGQTVPNLVTAKLGAAGKVSVYNALGNVHVIADVVGYYDATDATGSKFEGITPNRLLDSRNSTGGWGTPLGPNSTRDLVVTGGTTGVPTSATAVVLNVTATGGTAASYLQAYPADATQPVTANLLFAAGQTVPNLVTVAVGKAGPANGKVRFYNQLGSVDVIADVVGYYDSAGSGFFHPVNPTRMIDSRNGTGGYNTPWGPAVTRPVTIANVAGMPVPTGALGVVMNTTVTAPTANSFLTVFPDGVGVPSTANLLFAAGQTVPNLVVVKLSGAGKLAIFNQQGSVHVIGDVGGYFAAT